MDTVESLVRELVNAGVEVGIAASIITRAGQVAKRRKTNLFPRESKRLPMDWQPSEMDYSYALKIGMTPQQIGSQAIRFKNYYPSQTGSRGESDCWPSKWKYWCDNFMEKENDKRNRGLQPSYRERAFNSAVGNIATRLGIGSASGFSAPGFPDAITAEYTETENNIPRLSFEGKT